MGWHGWHDSCLPAQIQPGSMQVNSFWEREWVPFWGPLPFKRGLLTFSSFKNHCSMIEQMASVNLLYKCRGPVEDSGWYLAGLSGIHDNRGFDSDWIWAKLKLSLRQGSGSQNPQNGRAGRDFKELISPLSLEIMTVCIKVTILWHSLCSERTSHFVNCPDQCHKPLRNRKFQIAG